MNKLTELRDDIHSHQVLRYSAASYAIKAVENIYNLCNIILHNNLKTRVQKSVAPGRPERRFLDRRLVL